jgi:hypothetical protein
MLLALQMANTPEPDEPSGNSPEPPKPLRPKRGAFPTPKSDLDKAQPFIPDAGDEEGSPEESPDEPADPDSEKES